MALLSTMMGIVYCSKLQEPEGGVKGKSITQANPSRQGNSTQKSAAGGSSCSCAPYLASCRADCFFSDCCICWNPIIETGSCGCFFGVARCMSGSNTTNAGVTNAHSIKLYTARFRKFLNFLQVQGIDPRSMESSFEVLVKTAAESQPGVTDMVRVSADRYEVFFQAYQQFLHDASLQTQQKVTNYILTQSQLPK